jgi:hypothetical protein
MSSNLTPMIGLLFGIGGIGYFVFVGTYLRMRFRKYVARKFDVTIENQPSAKGWRVSGRSWLQNRGIEALEFLFFLGAFALWAVALLAVVWLTGGVSGGP